MTRTALTDKRNSLSRQLPYLALYFAIHGNDVMAERLRSIALESFPDGSKVEPACKAA